MATIRWYLATVTPPDSANHWAILDTTPSINDSFPSGWVVGTGATNHSELDGGTAGDRASTTFVGTTVPDGTLDTTLWDALRTLAPLNGTFASGNWTFQFAVISSVNAGAADGQIVFRLIKANADGSGATEITSAQQSASVCTNILTTPHSNGTLTFNPGAITLANQYLFVQVAWKRTGAGGMTTTNVRLRSGTSDTVGTTILTSDFTPSAVTVLNASVFDTITVTELRKPVLQLGTRRADSVTVTELRKAVRNVGTRRAETVGVTESVTTRLWRRVAYDNFIGTPGTDLAAHTPDRGDGWVNEFNGGSGNWQIAASGAGASTYSVSGSNISIYHNNTTLADNQAVEVTIASAVAPYVLYLMLRRTGFACYTGFWSAGGLSIGYEQSDGTFIPITTDNGATLTIGDVLRFEAVGARITLYKNGVQIVTSASPPLSYPSGIAGLAGMPAAPSTSLVELIDSYRLYDDSPTPTLLTVQRAETISVVEVVRFPSVRVAVADVVGVSEHTATSDGSVSSSTEWALVAHAKGGAVSGGPLTLSGIDTRGATFLQVKVASYNGVATPAISDSAGNVWTKGAEQVSGTARLTTWYVDSNTPLVSASHTVTIDPSGGGYVAAIFAAFSGSGRHPLDQDETRQTGGTTSTNCCPVGVDLLPSQDNSLITSGIIFEGGPFPPSIDSGLTVLEFQDYSSGDHFGLAFAWKVQPTIAAIDPNWSWLSTVPTASGVESWKPYRVPVEVSVDFTGPDNSSLPDPPWLTVVAGLKQVSNQATPISFGTRQLVIWNPSVNAFGRDQFAEVTIGAGFATAGYQSFLVVRYDPATTTGHVLTWGDGSGGQLSIGYLNGTLTPILTQNLTGVTVAPGDVVRLEADGGILRAYKNGVQIGTDQVVAGVNPSGNPGFSGSFTGYDNFNTFAGGDLGFVLPPEILGVLSEPLAPATVSATGLAVITSVIAFDAVSQGYANATSLTFAHTCTGVDRYLAVGIKLYFTDDLLSVTYNGVPLTFLGTAGPLLEGTWAKLYGLTAPDAGTHNVVITRTAANHIFGTGASYTHVAQTGQPEAVGQAYNGGSTDRAVLTAMVETLGAWLVGVGIGAYDGNLFAEVAGTEIRQDNSALGGAQGYQEAIDSGGPVPIDAQSLTVTKLGSFHYFAGVVAALAPAPVAVPPAAPVLLYPTRQFFRAPVTALSATLTIPDGTWASMDAHFANVWQLPFAAATLVLPAFATTPAGGWVELWGLLEDVDGTEDDTGLPGASLSPEGARYLGTWLVTPVNALQRRTITISLSGIEAMTLALVNKCGASITGTTSAPVTVRLRPFGVGVRQ